MTRPWPFSTVTQSCLAAAFLALVLSCTETGSTAQEADSAHAQPRDITGIEELPSLPPWSHWPWWLALATVGATGLLFACWKLRVSRPRPEPPPDCWALAEMERVAALTLPESSQAERYHTLISDIVRRYVELRFALRASQQTTTEFLAAARRLPALGVEAQVILGDFLERCDRAKFAPVTPSPEECKTVLEMARRFVALTAAQSSEARPAKPK